MGVATLVDWTVAMSGTLGLPGRSNCRGDWSACHRRLGTGQVGAPRDDDVGLKFSTSVQGTGWQQRRGYRATTSERDW
jgi:hypothetical protein